MPIDLFASFRSTALISLVAASFASPIVVKADAVADAGARIAKMTSRTAQAPPPERLVAGGFSFDKPASWDVLGASTAKGADPKGNDRIGAVVSGLCPGGSTGSTCKDGVRITFVAYSGGAERSLPALLNFRRELDDRLATEFRGFKAGTVQQRAGADGSRYLDYGFSYRTRKATRTQRIGVFRHANGSGVVALASGASLAKHRAEISSFLASSHELTERDE